MTEKEKKEHVHHATHETHHAAHHAHRKTENGTWGSAAIALIALALAVTAFNAVQLGGLQQQAATQGAIILAAQGMGAGGASTQTGAAAQQTALLAPEEVLPSGAPPVYGAELGINYDDVSPDNPQLADATIAALAKYDTSITLEGDAKERYIRITNSISCEYCCGAEAITFSNGEPACGCAHSYAMRGLAKYLLTEHPNEFSDEEILAELGKWKTLFFPGIMVNKANVLAEKGIPTDYISLASNQYRGIERQSSGDGVMVGGC